MKDIYKYFRDNKEFIEYGEKPKTIEIVQDDSYEYFRNNFIRLLDKQTYDIGDLYYAKRIYDFWEKKEKCINYDVYIMTNYIFNHLEVVGFSEYDTLIKMNENFLMELNIQMQSISREVYEKESELCREIGQYRKECLERYNKIL